MSLDTKMAWRNIWRNTRRSVLTISAVTFATTLLIFMLSWQFGSYDTMINSAVRLHTGHLQVQAKGYQDKRSMRLVVPEPESVGVFLSRHPGVAAHTFRATAFSLASSEERTYGAMVMGIDPEKEAKVSTLKKLVRRGRYLEAGDDLQAVMGKLLAENLHAKLGDEVVILGQARDGSIAASVFKVEGIYSSGQDEFDRSSIYVPLKTFQDVYGMGDAVHQVVAMGKTLQDVETIKQDISKHLAKNLKKDHLVVLDWKELMPGLIQSIKVDLGSGLIFYLILVVVVAFSILNTFLMAVFERTREFGVLLAVGTTPGRLTRLLLLESATMTLVGIMIGILLGCTVTLYFQSHGIAISGTAELMRQFGLPERMYPRLSLLSAAIGAGGVLIITLLTALYPALKVRRLHPVEAMTHVQAV